jgi:hypothetical protein
MRIFVITLALLASVHSRQAEWTPHRLVVDVKKKSEFVIVATGPVEIAQAQAEPRKGPGGARMEPITQLKELHLPTPLEGAVIAAPTGDNLQGLAEQVQARVKAAGGLDLPIRPAAEVAKTDLEKRTVIAIGNALTNAVVEVLYNKGFVYADRVYPGQDGYAVRTVHNPLGTGFNGVTACGSDANGVKFAVERLGEHIERAGGQRRPRGRRERRWPA